MVPISYTDCIGEWYEKGTSGVIEFRVIGD